MYEDELIPLFEKCGMIWDLRLMMDPMTGTNRGYAFITFTSRDSAYNAVREVSEAFSSELFLSRHLFFALELFLVFPFIVF
jgi:RNA recognition motif-containing protein